MDGCWSERQSDSIKCFVAKVKFDGDLVGTGFPIIKDQSITQKSLKLSERQMFWSRTSPDKVLLKRSAFKEEMESFLDISVPNVLDIIQKARLRS